MLNSSSSEHELHITHLFLEGNCITGVSPDTVCGLNSTSLTCHNNLTISSCLCDQGIIENNCRLTGKCGINGHYKCPILL